VPPLFYPFTVKIGEQEAEMNDRNDLFTIADPKDTMKLPKLGEIIKFLKGDS
jgi:hypothetical protein